MKKVIKLPKSISKPVESRANLNDLTPRKENPSSMQLFSAPIHETIESKSLNLTDTNIENASLEEADLIKKISSIILPAANQDIHENQGTGKSLLPSAELYSDQGPGYYPQHPNSNNPSYPLPTFNIISPVFTAENPKFLPPKQQIPNPPTNIQSAPYPVNEIILPQTDASNIKPNIIYPNPINNESAAKVHENISQPQNPEALMPKSIYEPINIYEKITENTNLDAYSQHKCEGFDINPDVDDRVLTISKFWIPITLMKNFGRYKREFVENIDKLNFNDRIVGWKKSRGDGNCYFRAVIARYLEIIHKYYNPLSYIYNFKAIIKKTMEFRMSMGLNRRNDEYIIACESIFSHLEKTATIKREDPVKCFMYILERLQEEGFDLNIVRVARAITHYALFSEENSEKLQEFGIDKHHYEYPILTMGEEAEGLTLLLLPLELGIQVVQYNIFENVIKEKFPNEDKDIVVQIVRRGGHYDILYTIQEMEIDQYKFTNGTYHFLDMLVKKD